MEKTSSSCQSQSPQPVPWWRPHPRVMLSWWLTATAREARRSRAAAGLEGQRRLHRAEQFGHRMRLGSVPKSRYRKTRGWGGEGCPTQQSRGQTTWRNRGTATARCGARVRRVRAPAESTDKENWSRPGRTALLRGVDKGPQRGWEPVGREPVHGACGRGPHSSVERPRSWCSLAHGCHCVTCSLFTSDKFTRDRNGTINTTY